MLWNLHDNEACVILNIYAKWYPEIIIFSIYSTCKTYIEWQANPTITTINTTAYPIENIEFPAITICSQGAAKDVVDTVLLKQFEEYLEEKGIEGSKEKEKNSTSSGKRRKRFAGVISRTLTKNEVA